MSVNPKTCFKTTALLACDLKLQTSTFTDYQLLLQTLNELTKSQQIEGWYQTQSHVERLKSTQALGALAQNHQYLIHLELVFLSTDQKPSHRSIHLHWNDQVWLLTEIEKLENNSGAYYYCQQDFLAIEPGSKPKTNQKTRVKYEIFWKKYTLAQLDQEGELLSYQPNQPFCARFVSSL
jgi:hypothetical protein